MVGRCVDQLFERSVWYFVGAVGFAVFDSSSSIVMSYLVEAPGKEAVCAMIAFYRFCALSYDTAGWLRIAALKCRPRVSLLRVQRRR